MAGLQRSNFENCERTSYATTEHCRGLVLGADNIVYACMERRGFARIYGEVDHVKCSYHNYHRAACYRPKLLDMLIKFSETKKNSN